jgi:Thrombospondin type 3 repeat
VGITSIGFAGNLWIIRQEVVFEPGTKLPRFPAFDPSLGYSSVSVFQQSSSAVSATPPGAITDFCTPLKLDSLSFGVTLDNPDTPANEGGIPVRTLPEAGTQIRSTFYSFSTRDADQDSIENTLDTCPFHFDAEWNPHSLGNPGPDDVDVVAGLLTGDGIPNSCDPTPTEATGTQPTDHDDDGFPNSGDNCPLHYNPDQADTDVNEAGEIVGDGIGDVCDTPGRTAVSTAWGLGAAGAPRVQFRRVQSPGTAPMFQMVSRCSV